MRARPAGVIAPLVTPGDGHGGVSQEGICGQIESVRPWISGLMPCIGAGEGWRLTTPQWRDAVTGTIRAAGGLPVYAGCQSTDWRLMKQKAQWAAALGADAVVLAVPADRVGQSDQEILRNFADVKQSVELPVVYYWESFICGRVVDARLCSRICDALDAVAVKDSMRSAEATTDLLGRLEGRANVLQGWEDLLQAPLAIHGYVGPLALLSPAPSSAFSDSPQWDAIKRESDRYGVLEPDYVARVKAELHARGVIPSAALFPGVPGAAWDE